MLLVLAAVPPWCCVSCCAPTTRPAPSGPSGGPRTDDRPATPSGTAVWCRPAGWARRSIRPHRPGTGPPPAREARPPGAGSPTWSAEDNPAWSALTRRPVPAGGGAPGDRAALLDALAAIGDVPTPAGALLLVDLHGADGSGPAARRTCWPRRCTGPARSSPPTTWSPDARAPVSRWSPPPARCWRTRWAPDC
ncbi:hypothetical protein NKG94_26465 [Micromonospora sp. M12]